MYGISELDLFGNAIADKLADRAAFHASYPRHVVSKVTNAYHLVQKIQLRLVAVLEDAQRGEVSEVSGC